ncbi:hypothetical protein CARUB_v10015802mg [Capsella rubella]|uniref:Uncharacterized protein n=1 Tax=Capsella rubella TaxID=81985 RepID=R0GAF5_9BRAS|nr:hypothetical protein CARUB_v10015802mg [Capsella rubella]
MGKYLVFFLFVLISFDSINSSFFPPFFKTFNIQFVNQLEFHKKLRILCKTGSFHEATEPTIFLNVGESTLIKFRMIPFVPFWCNFWQGPNYIHNVYFEAFFPSQKFIDSICNGMHPNVCTWVAKERAVYVRHNNVLRERYGWNTPIKQREIAPAIALTSEPEFDSYV